MKKLFFPIAFLFAIGAYVATVSHSHGEPAPTACQDQFYNHQLPDIELSKTTYSASKTYILCKTQYGMMDSSITKTALWSAEHLTADRIRSAHGIKRKDEFHPEPNLPFEDRATLADYLGSGYDRGHMSPDKDMPDALSMHESFSLGNMVPQNSCNNEIIWAAIEESVRTYTLQTNDDIYVVTGPIFNNTAANTTIGGSKVWVPIMLFKAVYDATKNELVIVKTPNANVQTYDIITLDALKDLTGVIVFPTIINPTQLTLPPLHKMSGSCKKGS